MRVNSCRILKRGMLMNTFSVLHRGSVGLMATGHAFDMARRNVEFFREMLVEQDIEVITGSPEKSIICAKPEEGYQVGAFFKSQDIDLLFVYLLPGAVPGSVLQGIRAATAPVVLVEDRTADCESTPDDNCRADTATLPDMYNAMNRCLIKPAGVVNGDTRHCVETEIIQWCRVASALRQFKGAIFGALGHVREGRDSLNFDPTSVTRAFRVHVQMLEMCQLEAFIQEAPGDDWFSNCAAGLKRLAEENSLSGLVYHYHGVDNNPYSQIAKYLPAGLALLEEGGFAISDEFDIKLALLQYSISSLDLRGLKVELSRLCSKSVIALNRVQLDTDISICGKVTILGLGIDEEMQYAFTAAQGEAVSTDNAIEIKVKTDPSTFVRLWSEYGNGIRMIIVPGEHANLMKKFATAMGLGYQRI